MTTFFLFIWGFSFTGRIFDIHTTHRPLATDWLATEPTQSSHDIALRRHGLNVKEEWDGTNVAAGGEGTLSFIVNIHASHNQAERVEKIGLTGTVHAQPGG